MEYVHSVIPYDTVSLSPSYGSVIPLRDGRILWAWGSGNAVSIQPFQANYSADEGATWTAPSPLQQTDGQPLLGVMDGNLLRLRSGALGLVQRCQSHPDENTGVLQAAICFHRSDDEGKTWSAPVPINPPDTQVFITNERALVLQDGRIVVPVYSGISPRPLSENPKLTRRFGEDLGNADRGTLFYSYAYYSDDEGQTWARSANETFVVLEKGVDGSFSMGEPTAVELKDGRLLMFGRTNLGRFFQCFSPDRGETWTEPEPSDLACYPSPCNLKRLPTTGDLLAIWNQAYPWETMIGLYRHRLTCAISQDEGATWQHHKNLESLDDITYIEPQGVETVLIGSYKQPVDRQRYHRAPGPLRYNQPTCTFLGDKVIITYGMCVWGDKAVLEKTYQVDYDELMAQFGLAPHDRGNKVRVLATDWFYS